MYLELVLLCVLWGEALNVHALFFFLTLYCVIIKKTRIKKH